MILAVIGAGGKTTYIHELALQYRREGRRVFVTTTTHMFREPDTLVTADPRTLLEQLDKTGYLMAGLPEGEKIRALPRETYEALCAEADVVLVEADGAKHKPVKYPAPHEPVIPDNADGICIVWGLHGLGRPIRETVFRRELAAHLLPADGGAPLTPACLQALLRKGYLKMLQTKYPDKPISIHAVHNGSLYQRALAALLEADMDVSLIREEWFSPKPRLFLCGGGHVALELAEFAARLDFRITVMDDRPEFANAQRFPMAEEILCADFSELPRHLAPGSYYVVVTRGHQADGQCVQTILGSDYRYLGMIGSRRKVAVILDQLRQAGFPEDAIASIHAPIGLAIGAATPAEIAVSILAEIIQEKSKFAVASASSELLNTQRHGTLCIILDKSGSTPRGAGSMMLVGEDFVLDTIGGGTVEFAAIQEARRPGGPRIRKYELNTKDSAALGMICGGSNTVLFLPV